MTGVYKVGETVIKGEEIPALLKRYQLMPQFLREVIIDGAITEIECSPEEQKAALEKFAAQHQLTSSEAQEAWLKSQNLTTEDLQAIAERPVKLEKFKQNTWSNKVENYFISRKSNLDHVVYSLIRTKNSGLAHELYFRVLEGEQSLGEAAREYSEGPESRTGGLLGPVPLSQPHPAISKLLSVSQPGQLWAPRPLAEWMVIIRLEKFIPAQLDESMRRRLIDELFETWLREQLTAVGSLEPLQTSVSSVL
ncbi:PPIC-type PPIASE domain protein [Lyngbya aestuarii BL J]|jgi:parvulin-like peptidyl-prolyl isomerase|uniref:peptidylprolyl isomerase n=1 Tax=Lyngbya aestuarii BL J TaxID=1348334 RepID=U7QM93_9CYAN|nr:peptidylprolyl isomerase [Lyngbya aestuarii]ERT08240.1 PPIC-type PPIASE domain protein [Lyngbya aestuarii BL J]